MRRKETKDASLLRNIHQYLEGEAGNLNSSRWKYYNFRVVVAVKLNYSGCRLSTAMRRCG